ncbi:MAG: alpha/beta hydrolase [Gammaproteobacteria bacterium]|nr:alpha/beta hydrolase [Gammaproteobacteria bacterium]MDE0286112.1 alpha/beta hydrolase [Gammaproteobacteria bacterium]MDE0514149.1 alpha/beta hydrolase [Gammaproteobacteria bacterium]
MIKTRLSLAVVLLIFLSGAVNAQDMSQYYTVQHPEDFSIDWTGFYHRMNEHTDRVRAQFPHHLDLAYGSDPKQRLDLYLPEDKVSNAPVFLFLHGGGFREGDRAHYGSVAEPFVKSGVITAVASYRLTGSGAHYPAQPGDVKNAVKWLFENIGEYGGNPEALYVGGHSAGAILSADIGVDRAWLVEMGMPKEILKAIIPVSGPYDVRARGRPGQVYTYAPTPELREQASPILHVNDPVPAALVAVGSEEGYQESSVAFTEALKAAGVDARYLLLEGEDHADTALSLANGESELFRQALEMILGTR